MPEEIPVAVASHPYDNNIGKSFRKGRAGVTDRQGRTPQTSQGLYFDEQWKRALQVNPSVVFVTGWNEWVAQRFVNRADSTKKATSAKFLGKPLKPGQTFFIDLFNEEYNRDIDPMKGGYSDNYYYQLVANVRRFKGIPSPDIASTPRTVVMDGNFSEWNTVKPTFIDPAGDVLHRNWPRIDKKLNYVNNTGRNDIAVCRVTHDNKNVYFYAKTVKKLTPSTSKNWMLLFIDSDQSAKTGWSGYDFLVNQTIKGNKSTVCKWNGKSWVLVGIGLLQYANNELELSIPLSVIRQTSGRVKLDLHWADNIQQVNQITEFFVNGDSAPDRRFNYRYNGK